MAYTTDYVHAGNAPETTLASDITDSSTTITLTSGTGWPSPSGGQVAYGVLDPGNSGEEKFTYTGKSGSSLTGCTRAKDSTVASAHLAGVKVRHIFSAEEASEANHAVQNTVGKITAANQLLVADGANSLAALDVAASRLVGRAATGDVDDLTVAQVKTLLALSTADLSDFDLTGIAAGSILYYNGSDIIDLGIGSASQVLAVNAGATAPEWTASTVNTEIADDPLWDAAGDIAYATAADTGARLAIGTAGQVLTVNSGATAPEWGPSPNLTSTVVKGADESVTSSTTLQNDDELLAALETNTDYSFEARLYVVSATTPDFKMTFTVPAAATLAWWGTITYGDGAAVNGIGIQTISGTAKSFIWSGTDGYITVFGSVRNGANAGNLTLQWAQDTSNGTAATVKAGSTLSITKES